MGTYCIRKVEEEEERLFTLAGGKISHDTSAKKLSCCQVPPHDDSHLQHTMYRRINQYYNFFFSKHNIYKENNINTQKERGVIIYNRPFGHRYNEDS